jgi:hypothetical protein
MKNLVLHTVTTVLLLMSFRVSAQQVGISISAGIRKSFELSKQSSIDLRQQIQANPEIKKYDYEYGDFFNEDGFWAIPDTYVNPDSIPGVPNKPDNELDDLPREVTIDWRSNTSVQYNYNFFPWLRFNTGYSLFFNGKEFRHTFRGEIDYRPLKHSKEKRKIDIAARTLYQYVGQPDDDEMEWESFLVPRVDFSWAFKKNHILSFSNSLNGTWDDGIFEFDRWRSNISIGFIYHKKHRFTFAYQLQQRLDKPRRTHGVSFGYEIRL